MNYLLVVLSIVSIEQSLALLLIYRRCTVELQDTYLNAFVITSLVHRTVAD